MEATPKRQFRRVAAWIYAVINPIIDSLQHELIFLDVDNLAWRASSGRSEFIKPIQEYVDVTQWPNFYDYKVEHAPFSGTFTRHDEELRSLNGTAKAIYEGLLSSSQFLVDVESQLGAYETQRPTIGPQFPSFNNSRADLPRVAAENVINNVENLPPHYLFAPFWNFASRALLVYRGLPVFESLHSSRVNLRHVSSVLKGALEEHRLSLSREFDVPAAPVPGVSFDA